MIKPLVVSLFTAVALTVSAFAAHIGDTVESIVTAGNRVPIPTQNAPTEITHIVLDSGVWSISGQVVVLSLSQPTGTLFTAANISVGSSNFVDGTSAIEAERVAGQGNIIRSMALTPRIAEVADGTQVFLSGGVFNPNSQVTAWGFISAVKVRNHVP